MKKKQILLNGKILSYYEYKPHLNSSPQGEDEATEETQPLSPLGERIQDRGYSKNTLMFLHGWMQDGKSFEEIFQKLEEQNIPYISLDLPGFGGSALSHDDMTVEEYGQVVQEAIEKLALQNPILVGHSFGGRISIYLSSVYSNISKIVLIGSAGITTPMNPLRYIFVKTGKCIFSLPGLSKLSDKVKSGISSSDYKSSGKLEKIFRNTISNDLRKYMVNIKIPSLLIWGDQDDQTPVSEGTIIHENIKTSQFVVLEGTHFIHKEKSSEITDMILDFIKK